MDALKTVLSARMYSARWLWAAGLFVLALLMSASLLGTYFQADFQQWICLLVAPLVLTVRPAERGRYRYGWASAAAMGLYATTGMKTFFLLGLGFYGFFLVEQFVGRLDTLALILLFLYLPVINYLITAFSFPLRMEMSAFTGQLLQLVGFPVEVQGNMFRVNEMMFSVDQACMGLKSLSTGLILLTLLIAHTVRQRESRFSFGQLGLVYGLGLGLLLLAGQMRMLLVVLLRSMPETLSHELIGLGSLLLYMVLPMYFLLKWFTGLQVRSSRDDGSQVHRSFTDCRFLPALDTSGACPRPSGPALDTSGACPRPSGPALDTSGFPVFRPKSFLYSSGFAHGEPLRMSFPSFIRHSFIFLLLLGIGGLTLMQAEIEAPVTDSLVAEMTLPGMEKRMLETGVAQFRNEDALLYVKPAVRFWGADHTPEVCWRASGYAFTRIDTLTVKGLTLWQARLVQETDTLYTAWWYENPQSRTHQQWDWRWQMMQGAEPFRMINVTTADPAELSVQCQYFTGSTFENSIFRPLGQPLRHTLCE